MAKFNFAFFLRNEIFGNGENLVRVSKFLLGGVIFTKANETLQIEKTRVPLPEVQLARKVFCS